MFSPQGLPICFALAMSIIARRLATRSVLVKNLSTVETMGCMSVLCSDKTGTLTEGRMFVHTLGFVDKAFSTDNLADFYSEISTVAGIKSVHEVASTCNACLFESTPENMALPISKRKVIGDSTDVAIFRFSEELGIKSSGNDDQCFSIPFNSKNKWMLVITSPKDKSWKYEMFMKGAPEILIPYCSSVLQSDGSVVSLNEDLKMKISSIQNEWSSRGLRVLALLKKNVHINNLPLNNDTEMEKLVKTLQNDLVLVGLLGIRDPPREGVKETVDIIRNAGVRVFMVTGDFQLTATSIARQVNFYPALCS